MLTGHSWEHIELMKSGSVYPIKSGRQTMGFAFYYRLAGGDKQRKVVTGCNHEELREKAVRFLDEKEKECTSAKEEAESAFKEVLKPVRFTFREVGDLWIKEYSQRMNRNRNSVSYSTVECRDLAYRTILPYIGDLYMDEITQDVADQLVEKCSVKKDGTYYSHSTVDKIQQTFHMILKYGRKKGYYHQELELTSLAYLERADTDSRFLDREQVAEVLKILKNNPRYYVLVKLIMATGLRQEEAFALYVDDFVPVAQNMVEVHINKSVVEVDKNKYCIVPKLKSDRGRRIVVVAKSIYDMVMGYCQSVIGDETASERMLRKKNKTEGLIFADREKKVLNKRTFERSFASYLKRNGGKELGYETTLHMFRHSYASLMAETQPAEVVAKLLGDSMSTVEKNYYSLSRKVKQNVSVSSEGIMESIESLL